MEYLSLIDHLFPEGFLPGLDEDVEGGEEVRERAEVVGRVLMGVEAAHEHLKPVVIGDDIFHGRFELL